jgi:hypothetical protein
MDYENDEKDCEEEEEVYLEEELTITLSELKKETNTSKSLKE